MEIYSIGGYNEVGKNMTVVVAGDDAFIFDAGLYIPAIIELQEQNVRELSENDLRKKHALPNDLILDKLGIRKKIRAIFLSHGHLDHIGGIPYLAHRYNAPVIGSPYTISVLKRIMDDERKKIPNKITSVQVNSSIKIKGTKSCTAEFVNMTHSIPNTSMIALHTSEGTVIYGNDFKLDDTPVLGNKPNYNMLKRISKQGVKAIIVDSLYCGSETKTPSERVARNMVEEVLLTVRNDNAGIFITTFSSHIARLKSIVEFGRKLDRKIIFLGRSLNKYVSAASDINLISFRNKIQMKTYKNQVASTLKQVAKDRGKYLVVCTGHQGEPGSILERISRKDLPFEFKKSDNVIFSSKTIPAPINIKNKGILDKRLKKLGARIFDKVHVSGHGGKEDLRDLISLINPEHVIPSHNSLEKLKPMLELGRELGYSSKKNIHLLSNGKKLKL